MSVNMVALSGNLTRDSEMRQTQSGSKILTFGIAVNERVKNSQTGQWEDRANFVDCILFGNRADWLSQDLKKGKKVSLEGKLRYSTWERDGQRRSKLEVVVSEIDYERPPKNSAQGQQQPTGGQQYQQPNSYTRQHNPQNGYQQPDMYDDDIPW